MVDLNDVVLEFSWLEYSVFCTMLLLSLLIGVYFGCFTNQNSVAEYLLGGKKMSVFPPRSAMVDLDDAVLEFSWVEYSVFCTMLLLSLLIGVYFGWFTNQNSVAEYLLGGKKMSVLPVMLSLVFSHVSGVTLLGIPAEIYSYGTQYCAIVFSNIVVLILVNYFYLPVFFELQLNSLYEYLELRFSKGTRTLASLIFAISLIIFIPIVVYVPALAFNRVTGVSVHVIAPIISLICIFYTSFGGLKAVVWTDALQSLFTLGSTVFIVWIGFSRIGSIQQVWQINDQGHRLEMFNMELSIFERNTFWTMFIGSIFFWLAQIAVHPGAMQRFIAVSSFQEAKLVMLYSAVGFFVIKGLAVVVGLLLYATYHDCDPVATKMVEKSGQLLPYYVMQVAQQYPGLTGLFISGVVSAALSTMSAGLNTVAGTLYEDFVQFVLGDRKQTDMQQSFTLKLIVLFLGLFCASLVFIVHKLGTLFQMTQSLIGVTNGALVGIFSLGIFFPRANAKGAMAGSVASLAAMSIIIFSSQYYIAQGLIRFPGKITSVAGCPTNFTDSLPFNASALVQTYTGIGSPVEVDQSVPSIFQVSYMYYCALGALIVLVVGMVVSWLSEPPPPSCLEPRLFSPCVRYLLPSAAVGDKEYSLVYTTEPTATTEGA